VGSASISELKNRLSAYLDRVRAGETVVVTDRGIPVARLEPTGDVAARVGRLEREGLVRPGRGKAPRLDTLAAATSRRSKHSALDALLEERREGR
jgi:prevent-host-death family protein